MEVGNPRRPYRAVLLPSTAPARHPSPSSRSPREALRTFPHLHTDRTRMPHAPAPVTVVKFITTQCRPHNCFRVIGSNIRKDMIIHRDRWSAVAAAQARDIADFHVTASRTCETSFNYRRAIRKRHSGGNSCRRTRELPLARARLDENADKSWLRCEFDTAASVCAKTAIQVRLGQKPVAKLDSPQVVEDHSAASRKKSAKRKNIMPPSEKWSANSLAY